MFKKFLFPFVFCFFCCFTFSAEAVTDAPPVLHAFLRDMIRVSRYKAQPHTTTVDQDFAALMESIRIHSPELADKIERMPRAEVLQTLMNGIHSGVRLQTKEETFVPDKKAVRRARTICRNRILYISLFTVDYLSMAQLKQDLAASGRLANKPCGGILDLRSASGGDYALPEMILSLFAKDPCFSTRPLVVLTSRQTTGPAELLAVLLEKRFHAATMGEPGDGHLFPEVSVRVAGLDWSVPVTAKEYANFPPEPHTPLIPMAAGLPAAPDQLGNPEYVGKDPALRRAADLLFSLSALQKNK